jgi:hypothetical protein
MLRSVARGDLEGYPINRMFIYPDDTSRGVRPCDASCDAPMEGMHGGFLLTCHSCQQVYNLILSRPQVWSGHVRLGDELPDTCLIPDDSDARRSPRVSALISQHLPAVSSPLRPCACTHTMNPDRPFAWLSLEPRRDAPPRPLPQTYRTVKPPSDPVAVTLKRLRKENKDSRRRVRVLERSRDVLIRRVAEKRAADVSPACKFNMA